MIHKKGCITFQKHVDLARQSTNYTFFLDVNAIFTVTIVREKCVCRKAYCAISCFVKCRIFVALECFLIPSISQRFRKTRKNINHVDKWKHGIFPKFCFNLSRLSHDSSLQLITHWKTIFKLFITLNKNLLKPLLELKGCGSFARLRILLWLIVKPGFSDLTWREEDAKCRSNEFSTKNKIAL